MGKKITAFIVAAVIVAVGSISAFVIVGKNNKPSEGLASNSEFGSLNTSYNESKKNDIKESERDSVRQSEKESESGVVKESESESIKNSESDKNTSYGVLYITDLEFYYNESTDLYMFFFSLLNENDEYIRTDYFIDVRVVNDNNEMLYVNNGIKFSESSFDSYVNKNGKDVLYTGGALDRSKIKEGYTPKGKIYFKVYNYDTFGYFKELQYDIKNLPYKIIPDSFYNSYNSVSVDDNGDNYKLKTKLKDQNGDVFKETVLLSIVIKNNNEEIVYEKKINVEPNSDNYYECLIQKKDILSAKTYSGKLMLDVIYDGEICLSGEKSIGNLPCKIIPASFYISLNNNGDNYKLRTELKDQNGNIFKGTVLLSILIKNNNGEIVYEKKINVEPSSDNYYECLIQKKDILSSKTYSGKLTFDVIYDGEICLSGEKSISDLPLVPLDITLPTPPLTISYRGFSTVVICKISDIWVESTHTSSGEYAYVYLDIQKTYDSKGDNYSRSCCIGYKLYDSKGYVVESGTCYSTNIKVMEKAICKINFYYLDLNETYRLELLDSTL